MLWVDIRSKGLKVTIYIIPLSAWSPNRLVKRRFDISEVTYCNFFRWDVWSFFLIVVFFSAWRWATRRRCFQSQGPQSPWRRFTRCWVWPRGHPGLQKGGVRLWPAAGWWGEAKVTSFAGENGQKWGWIHRKVFFCALIPVKKARPSPTEVSIGAKHFYLWTNWINLIWKF